ncbi:hypothetical protein [Serratia fonticola]|uniref:hypothetical protein n=1 Tax=Serratia fonticola TaxID=47917 RepID=UPI0034C6531B
MIYLWYLKGKKGKAHAVLPIDEKTEDRAKRRLADFLEDLEEELGEEAPYFKARLTTAYDGVELPPAGKLCEEFCIHNELDGDTWQVKTPSTDMFISNCTLDVKLIGALEFGANCLKLTKEKLNNIEAIIANKEDIYAQNLLQAGAEIELLKDKQPEFIIHFVDAIATVWPADGRSPSIEEIKAFFVDFNVIDDNGFDVLTEKWKSKLAVTAPQGKPVEFKPIDLSAMIYKRPQKITFDTLNLEIACALYPGDVDLHNISTTIFNWGKDLIAKNDDRWRAWSNGLTLKIPNIKFYSRNSIFDVIRNAPHDINLLASDIEAYAGPWLTANGVWEPGIQVPDSNASSDAAKPSVADASTKQTKPAPVEPTMSEQKQPVVSAEIESGQDDRLMQMEARITAIEEQQRAVRDWMLGTVNLFSMLMIGAGE